MGRQKGDGRGRLGGRQKGTPNKSRAPLGEWILGVVDRNRSKFEKDLAMMTAQERLKILANLIAVAARNGGGVTAENKADKEMEEGENAVR